MNECYAAIYAVESDRLVEVEPEQLIKPENVSDWLQMHNVDLAVGTAIGVYEMNLSIPTRFQEPQAAFMIEWALGQGEDLKDMWQPAELAAPLYVRDRVALTIKERAEGQRL